MDLVLTSFFFMFFLVSFARHRRLLIEVERVGKDDIVSFLPGHDDVFAIHKPDLFFKEIWFRSQVLE